MTYQIRVKGNAEKDLYKLKIGDKKGYFRCCLALIRISQDPFVGKELNGEFEGCFAVRVWPYRIVYNVDKNTSTIYVLKVKHRKDVYC